MKVVKFTLTILAFTLLQTNSSIAQQVDGLKILPESPGTSNTTRIVTENAFSNSPCELATYSVNRDDHVIEVIANFRTGIALTPCYSKDTFTIGNLNAGIYELIYTVIDTVSDQSDKDTTEFTVQENTSSNQPENWKASINLYPNPVENHLTVVFSGHSGKSHRLSIISVIGKKLKSIETRQATERIDMSNLPDGTYFIKIRNNDNEQEVVKRVVKNQK